MSSLVSVSTREIDNCRVPNASWKTVDQFSSHGKLQQKQNVLENLVLSWNISTPQNYTIQYKRERKPVS